MSNKKEQLRKLFEVVLTRLKRPLKEERCFSTLVITYAIRFHPMPVPDQDLFQKKKRLMDPVYPFVMFPEQSFYAYPISLLEFYRPLLRQQLPGYYNALKIIHHAVICRWIVANINN